VSTHAVPHIVFVQAGVVSTGVSVATSFPRSEPMSAPRSVAASPASVVIGEGQPGVAQDSATRRTNVLNLLKRWNMRHPVIVPT
jgi:hypothetical protein